MTSVGGALEMPQFVCGGASHRDLHAIFRHTAKLRARTTSQGGDGNGGVVTTPTGPAHSGKSGEVRSFTNIAYSSVSQPVVHDDGTGGPQADLN
jgi:hypothetical protein